MPLTTHCPACGYPIAGKKQVEKVDRRAVLSTYDSLPQKQVDILFFLHRFTLASQQQIADTFSDATSPRERKISASKHLSSLLNHNLVDRHVGSPRLNGRVFFSLTPGGMFACEVESKGDSRNVKRLKEVRAHSLLASAHIRHHLATVDVMSSFVQAEREGRGELVGHKGDKETTISFPYLGSRRKIQPDSTLLWSAGGTAYNAFLEVENHKASNSLFAEKLTKYLWFENAGDREGDIYKRTLGVNRFPILLVVACREGQLPGLRQGIIRGSLAAKTGTIPDISRRVVVGLTCLDYINADGLFGEVWEAVLQARGPLGFEGLFEFL